MPIFKTLAIGFNGSMWDYHELFLDLVDSRSGDGLASTTSKIPEWSHAKVRPEREYGWPHAASAI